MSGLSELVNALLLLYRRPTYLEVGVWDGGTFMAVEAARKVAVDVAFLFDVGAAGRAQPHCAFHQMPSDRYFGEIAGGVAEFDLILLDGLHTFEQTLRDLLNAAERLKPQGLIVIDDVRPDSELAALPSQEEAIARRDAGEPWDRHWMGDVYRLVYFIDSFMQGWTYRITTDLGQLIMWRQARQRVPDRRVEAVAQLSYAAMLERSEVFRPTPLDQIRADAADALGLRVHVPWTADRVIAGVKRRLPASARD
jgi:hypothetical protein